MLEDILKRVETGTTTVEDAEFLRTYIQNSILIKSEVLSPLPCPFCGSRNVVCHEGSTYNWWVVECENCGARGPEVRRYMDGEVSADERAIGEWNIRKKVFTKTRYTIEEFKELTTCSDWKFTDDIVVELAEAVGDCLCFAGCAARTAELGGFVITKEEDFDVCSNDPSSLKTSDHRWTMEGFTVVDNSGKEFDATALSKHLPKAFGEIDYSEVING